MDQPRWTSGLLERDEELRVLGGLLDGAREGRGEAVVVEGPAGIGKSSLLKACGERAKACGMEVMSVRGDELVMESSFAAVRELLWRRVQKGGLEVLEGAARLAAPVFDPEPAAADRERAFSVLHGLYWLVADLASGTPLVLSIDDAQWLDPASARFVAYLARRIDSIPALMVIGLRTGEKSAPPELAAAVTGLADSVLRPEALSEGASVAVVREVLGPRADEELCRSCHEATRGNPFYLRELAAAIQAQGSRPTIELAHRVRSLGGGAISASVLIRLARLGSDCERLAQALCVLGPRASLRNAANLANLDREHARSAADALHGADLLSAGPALSFVHPIVNEAISSQLSPARRAALHTESARLLAAEGASADRVAAHLLSAEPYGDAWVLEALRDAAREASARGAPEAAMAYLRRALSEPPSEAKRLDVLIELGRAQALLGVAGDFPALREALDLARDPKQRVEIAFELALALFGVLRNAEAAAVLEHVLDQPGGLDPATMQMLEQPLIAAGIDDLAAAPRFLARARPYFERASRGEQLDPRMLSALAAAAAATDMPSERAAAMAQQALEDERLLSRWLDDGYVTACLVLGWTDRVDAAVTAIERGLREAQRRGSTPMFLQLTIVRGDVAFRAGELDVAEEYARRGLELSRELGAEDVAGILLAQVLLERAALDAAAELIERMEISCGTTFGMELLANRGRIRVALGHLEPGLADLLEANRRTSTAGQSLSVATDWAHAAVTALSRLGRHQEARELARRELESAVAVGAPRRLGIALSICGSLDAGDEGLRLLRQAVQTLEGSPARLEQARALVRLGVGLRGRGRVEDARAVLLRALDLAQQCAGGALAGQAREELVASGARPRRAAMTGPEALTPAERRTAGMAAEGLSNREIAQSLFVSTKTVETQLHHAYRKLGIGRRAELARALSMAQSERAGDAGGQ